MSNTPKIKAAGPGKAPSASEQVINSGRPEYSATDARGRLIVLRKPTTWDRFALPKILGAEAANPMWQLQAQMLLHLKRVGKDDDISFSSQREMKAIVDMLGDDGYDTVNELFAKHFMQNGTMPVDKLCEFVTSVLEDYLDDEPLNEITKIIKTNYSVQGEDAKAEIKN